IDRIRLLTSAHIFEKSIAAMVPLERNIEQTQNNLSEVAREYEPLTTFPGERQVWEKLWEEVGDIRQPLANVLQLSRMNRDAEARQAMLAIEPRFDSINQDAEHLLTINEDAAHNAIDEVQALQRRTLMVFVVLTGSATFLGLFVSVWVIRTL